MKIYVSRYIKMDKIGIPKRRETVFVVIDVQDKFRPAIPDIKDIITNINKLIGSFEILKVPMIFTEQYPKGLGATVKEIRIPKNSVTIEKTEFSCLSNKGFKNKVKGYKHLVIAGIESHVCILQTTLEALSKGISVHLVADAVSSRKNFDKEVAIERAKNAGAFITTTESIIFQLLGRARTEEFKKILKIVK